jgi:hypothetical protein
LSLGAGFSTALIIAKMGALQIQGAREKYFSASVTFGGP